MSFIQRIIEKLDAGLWHFVRLIHSANHELPYHDFVIIENIEGEEALVGYYNVGQTNINAHGDQHKLFTSKHTNIWAQGTAGAVTLRFNDSKNALIVLPIDLFSETPIQYQKTFLTNISTVYYSVPVGAVLFMYFEGVLPQEARDAE